MWNRETWLKQAPDMLQIQHYFLQTQVVSKFDANIAYILILVTYSFPAQIVL